jgi:hypothetical protein
MPDPCDHALGRATGSPPRLLDGVAISAAGVAAAAAALHLTGAEAIPSALVALAVRRGRASARAVGRAPEPAHDLMPFVAWGDVEIENGPATVF